MRSWGRVLLAAVLGAVVGAGGTLALPIRGTDRSADPPPPEPGPRVAERVVGEAPIPTVLAWSPGSLPGGYAASVRRLRWVEAATTVRSGTAWLERWEAADGSAGRPPAGYRVPVEVAAVRPSSYGAFVPPAERALMERLSGGGAVMSRTGAELRGVGEGGLLTIGDRSLRVHGMVDDALIGAHEIAVSETTGVRLGITRPRYLLVAPRPDIPRRRIEEGLRGAVPAGVRLRVRGPGETPVFRHGDAVLPPLRLKELFGEFAARPAPGGMLTPDPRWVEEHIVEARVPVLGAVRCHRAVVSQIRGALEELARRGLGDRVDPSDYGGCFSPRFANRSPDAGISHHSWGIAIDLNVSGNLFGREPTMAPRVIEVFERHGFGWGGRWLIPDGMHFEFLRFPSGN